MEPVVFLSTSPTFMLVQNGLIPELDKAGLITLECQKTIQNNSSLVGPRRWYDFSRTAASVLRLYMLEASGMRMHFNPNFGAGEQYLQSCLQTEYPPPALLPPRKMEMAHGSPHRAQRLAGEFDRLFPHFLIENQLKKMNVCQTTLSGCMHVVYFGLDEGTIYEINATMNVTLQQIVHISASLHVVVSRHRFNCPIDPFNAHQFPRYILLKELIEEWSPSQYSFPSTILPSFANLGLN